MIKKNNSPQQTATVPHGVLGVVTSICFNKQRWSIARFNPAIQTGTWWVKSLHIWTGGDRENWGATLLPFAKALLVTCHLLSLLQSPLKRNKGERSKSLLRTAFIPQFAARLRRGREKEAVPSVSVQCTAWHLTTCEYTIGLIHWLKALLLLWLLCSVYCMKCATR